MSKTAQLQSGPEHVAVDDLYALSDLVAKTWTAAADADWSTAAGTVEWSCLKTADHAVDCVFAPAFFLASRNVDAYRDVGLDLTLGPEANPRRLVESLRIATRLLAGLRVTFEPPADLCYRLREHTRPRPMWKFAWNGLEHSDNPWNDLLEGSGRHRNWHRNSTKKVGSR